ncbi:MAG: hypothetical protein AAF125_16650, partial [Chloroflexota bacterium]
MSPHKRSVLVGLQRRPLTYDVEARSPAARPRTMSSEKKAPNRYRIHPRLLIVLTVICAIPTAAILYGWLSDTRVYTYLDNADSDDMLGYITVDGDLRLHDPRTREDTLIMENVEDFRLGHNGAVAFTRPDDPALYVYNHTTPERAPQRVLEAPIRGQQPLLWDPHGRYLAFMVRNDFGREWLYVWDGERSVNIMPTYFADGRISYPIATWSSDGRLAFVVSYPSVSRTFTPAPETYLWDGTQSVNTEQKLLYGGSRTGWGPDNPLIFVPGWNDNTNHFYVWDGVSMADNRPDPASFQGFTYDWPIQYVVWMKNGLLAIAPTLQSTDLV